ncbi:hypothetical protein COMNV_00601 [Commensalibacter sp. Nvir]|uniref:hypothetical protein n=1 Tax=Commensalibacter sp. Nvir TaxID=3069817 RepID=UPI002D71D6F3|nr:hypothetical protein COMNV_00601 [Commensalibacter sp. Nvir]
MAKKNKVKQSTPLLIRQAGVQQRWKRGELELEEAIDPDHPHHKTNRLRRKCAYDEMYGRGMITIEQRNYAERYAILCEKALGATQDLYAKISLLSVSRNRWEPTQAQHEAYEKLFVIWNGVGKYHIDILNKIIFGNMNINKIAQQQKILYHYAFGQIISSFILLEQVFEEKSI